ncbi:hypothetical protein ACTTAI_04865 [Rhodobacter capsulatus]|uniref:hypothetical protein n=1 Tax=Rhodobacter capsulatus TaxID=1061 RepID=UPI0040266DC3
MKSSLPLIALAALLSSTVVGALSAAPIDSPLFAGNTAAALATSKVAAPAVVQAPSAQPVQLADNDHDDDDDDDDDGFFGWFGHHGGGHHGHHGDGDGDHGGQNCPAGATNCANAPQAAGTVAPPANGLFAPGAKPQVQSN